ncbi:MAG: hypothetical protein JSS96_12980, partial [Bacteroidetes bacterium]|nr:hypothetical protein [Bacteroidota bacterium]
MSTSSKKQIVDFLWEWCEKYGDWAKLLIYKIITTESELSEEDAGQVFDYFLQSIKLKSGLDTLNFSKPKYTPTTKKIKLISLANVKGVNKLADGQEILFSKNLTVIYGANGSGKTGYGRILKMLGHSYDPRNIILGNIYKASIEQQTATIKYSVDDDDQVFTWNGKDTNEYLHAISVFNSNCVSFSLNEKRDLLISPIGFELFNLVSQELNYLGELLQKEIEKHPTHLSWIDTLNQGTPQQIFASSLTGKSSISKLEQLADFKDEHQKLLEEKIAELKSLDKGGLEKEINQLRVNLNEIGSVIIDLKFAAEKINEHVWNKLKELTKNIKILESEKSIGLKEIAESNNIEFYKSSQFYEFIQAADEYLKLLNKPDYPNSPNEICIYCHQKLSDSTAKEL